MVKVFDGTLQSFAWATNFAILCNWFPRKGRGILIGLWATNPSLGDIIGQQLFIGITGDSTDEWNLPFYWLGGIVFAIGCVNLLFLQEYPSMMDLEVKEQG